jgi:hypothetical protein
VVNTAGRLILLTIVNLIQVGDLQTARIYAEKDFSPLVTCDLFNAT